ncbi:26S protease regulatory subunit 6B homolog [Sesamum indicum]|uniref:26S protease regulatory subunit 6B homolog n=1 Tax=Sesamum indicum TaxID=4182 RepID=A0A6I9SPD1_SESIN|nr:26S protease regulatory subunit 6B homolog [Sesamum indicum]
MKYNRKNLKEEMKNKRENLNEANARQSVRMVSKLVDLYKGSSEEWSQKAIELEGIIKALEMDGFDQTVNMKVIMETNRADTLDLALLRLGRLDRNIKFPLPDRRQKRLVFQVNLKDRLLFEVCWFLKFALLKMNLSDELDLEDYVSRPYKSVQLRSQLFAEKQTLGAWMTFLKSLVEMMQMILSKNFWFAVHPSEIEVRVFDTSQLEVIRVNSTICVIVLGGF